jgi:hypothetical protein
LVWRAHPIAAPQSILLAGASYCRATINLFGRPILLPRHNQFVWPAHPIALPPIHTFAGASYCRAACSYFGPFIFRLVSLRRHIYLGRRIAAPTYLFWLAHLQSTFAAPQSILLAGAFHRCAAIFSFGGRIPLLRHHLFFQPAHPIVVLQYFLSAGASHCCAAIYSFGRRIPSSRRNIFFRRAHPIAAPPSILLAGASIRCTTLPILAGINGLFWPTHPLASPPYRISVSQHIPSSCH